MALVDSVFERVVALGAVSAGADLGDAVSQRAYTVCTMAGEQVLAYIGKTEAEVLALTDSSQRGVVYTVAADAAGMVLARNSTSSPGGYDMDGPWQSGLLSDDQKAVLDRVFPADTIGGTKSVIITRAEESTWLVPYYDSVSYPWDVIPT